MAESNKKTIVFGIDGVCWEYLNPLLDSKRLPNLARLMQGGTHGILKSTQPPLSPLAWSSFLTGRNPENHGVVDWWHAENDKLKFRPSNALDRKCSHFWNYLNEVGVRVGIQNIPLTYPAAKIDGYYLSGFDSPENGRHGIHPPGIRASISKTFGAEFPVLPSFSTISKGRSEEFKKRYFTYNDRQTELALELIEDRAIDVLVVNYQTADHFSHKMKDYSDLEEALENIDHNLGRFMTAYPDADFIILSDHGSIRTRGAFLILDWLQDKGYLTLKKFEKKLRCTNILLANVFNKNWGWKGTFEKAARMLLTHACAILPDILWRNSVGRLGGGEPLHFYCPPELIDIKRSKLSFCSGALSGFYINPTLSDREHGKVCAELIEDLKTLNAGESNEPVFPNVMRSKEEDGHGPDILAWGSQEFHFTSNCRAGSLTKDEELPYCVIPDGDYFGAHTEDGIYLFHGTGFHRLDTFENLHITDVPATILALYGIPTPGEFDGSAAWTCLSGSQEEAQASVVRLEGIPSDTGANALTAEEEEEVKQKLKSLGYL